MDREPAQESDEFAPMHNEAEPQSLDAAMSGVSQVPENHDPAIDPPIVEESSDF
jgi:hypothetical protein